ncbi:polysaccharide deacetylase family protein [Halomonas sp. CS7]|uniref:Polysaccharide deacetylase family protein n=1 Tax=Halomonas pelophila TaxID=3151122 RepID=A0ABV1NDJ7_9GAMM
MSASLTIVMYHYVRPLQESHFPDLKALDLTRFCGQLDFIQHHYQVVTMEQVIAATRGELMLPERSLLLTFDDGYRDHYEYVLPLLIAREIQGSFFPPACSVRDRRVLDVNKIHFILASVKDSSLLVAELFAMIEEHRTEYNLRSNEEYFLAYSGGSRYDTPDVTFIKRLLQKGLPMPLREKMVNRLFRCFVTEDERGFAENLYMSANEIRELYSAGMAIGSHGDRHLWLNTLSDDDLESEIDASLEFLSKLGVLTRDWVMCYPYGGYNDAVLAKLRKKDCALGLTVEVALADPAIHDPLCLPRLDTNDLPPNSKY